MRYATLPMILCLLTSSPLDAQEKPGETDTAAGAVPESHIVQLTEFHLASPFDAKLTASEIVQRLTRQSDGPAIEAVERIWISTISGTESTARFERETAVTVGTSTSGNGTTTRRLEMQEVGTIVQLAVTPRGEKVLVELSYQSSRFAGEGADDSPPDMVSTQIRSTQLVKIGEPSLVGGVSAGDTSFLLLSVEH